MSDEIPADLKLYVSDQIRQVREEYSEKILALNKEIFEQSQVNRDYAIEKSEKARNSSIAVFGVLLAGLGVLGWFGIDELVSDQIAQLPFDSISREAEEALGNSQIAYLEIVELGESAVQSTEQIELAAQEAERVRNELEENFGAQLTENQDMILETILEVSRLSERLNEVGVERLYLATGPDLELGSVKPLNDRFGDSWCATYRSRQSEGVWHRDRLCVERPSEP